MSEIVIHDLELNDIGLSEGMAKFMIECILHCFSSQNHTPGVKMKVKTNDEEEEYAIIWEIQELKNLKYSMNDADRTTDFGAMGISLLLTTILTEYTYFITSMKGNGFDFWLFREEPDELDYTLAEGRLEISGIRKETVNNSVSRRLKIKRQQISKSDSLSIRKCISIIEFERPQSVFEWH